LGGGAPTFEGRIRTYAPWYYRAISFINPLISFHRAHFGNFFNAICPHVQQGLAMARGDFSTSHHLRKRRQVTLPLPLWHVRLGDLHRNQPLPAFWRWKTAACRAPVLPALARPVSIHHPLHKGFVVNWRRRHPLLAVTLFRHSMVPQNRRASVRQASLSGYSCSGPRRLLPPHVAGPPHPQVPHTASNFGARRSALTNIEASLGRRPNPARVRARPANQYPLASNHSCGRV